MSAPSLGSLPLSSPEERLILADNLEALGSEVPDAAVDLCYLDPPFFSGRDHGAFDDRWRWDGSAAVGLDQLLTQLHGDRRRSMGSLLSLLGETGLGAYIVFLALRLVEVRRTLADHGAMFLHCDPIASPYLRLACDIIFGRSSFLNEVVWRYRRWPIAQRAFQRMHDVLLFYAVDPGHPERRFHVEREPRAPSTQKRWGDARIHASHRADGRRAPSQGGSTASEGVPLSDVWELPIVAPSAHERTGYPTQKPLRLLERLIRVASSPGDQVLDPFCGSGTTLVAAQQLGRRFIGIDCSTEALEIAKQRLDRGREGEGAPAS